MARYWMIGFLLVATLRAELIATFTRDGVTDTRLDRFPALAVEPGEPATPFLTPGKFTVVWTGKLQVPRRQRLVFSFEGGGQASLKIRGREILVRSGELAGEASPSTRLNPGEHDIELTYTSREDGSAGFRLFWEEVSFPRQSLPASAFKVEATDATREAIQQRRGRELFATQSCAKCHTSAAAPGAFPMPEMAEIGPILFGIGDRASESWLRHWIASPHQLKPGTSMPALVDAATAEGRQQASDLAAYLTGFKGAPSSSPAVDVAEARVGGVHFHELGCVGCHHPPDAGPSDPARIPLNNVASKYLPGALVDFLKKPEAFHPFSKMPNFHLSESEAASIAAYLTNASAGKETRLDHPFPEGDASRGAKLAESLQCGVCHPGMPMSPATAPAPLDGIFKRDWMESGCVAPEEKRGKSPVLNLNDEDREALVVFSKTGPESLTRENSAEYATRQLTALRCTSCHAIDDHSALLASVHSSTEPLTAHLKHLHERLDQSRPSLTFTGEMLYTQAIEDMLSGSVDSKPRPWLAMRMPAFTSRASNLAKGISKHHGLLPNAPAPFLPDAQQVKIGNDLVHASGFGCTTCHGVGDMKPTAAFEVEGLNFNLTSYRIRHEFYQRWMDHPQSVTPGTKMPRYSEGNQSQRLDILEGDASRQFEAIWHYLHSVERR
jgi:cytochrome c2